MAMTEMNYMSGGGGSVKQVTTSATFTAGTNTVTVNDITNIKAVLVHIIWNNNNGGPNYAYLDDNDSLQQYAVNTSVFKINDISGNTFTYAYNASYAPSNSCEYTVIGI